MKLTAKLALAQLKTNRKRAIWTLLGIVLSTSMITAVFGFAATAMEAVHGIVGGELRDVYYATAIGTGIVLSSVIVAASVIVISNSFRVSAGERLSQFGILKSVGATKRQIAESIMYESVLLSIVGIPVGIAVGLLVQFIGVEIANHLIGDSMAAEFRTMFGFVIAWQAILVSVGIGFGTVLLSAWLPARKAAKIPAISAILRHGDVKVKAKHVRANWLVKTIFGFEGTLASKSLKRSRRNFRATVVSLTISIILFIAASSFGAHLNRMATLVVHATDADVIGEYRSAQEFIFSEDGYFLNAREHPLSITDAASITARLQDFPNTTVMGVGTSMSSWRVPGALFPTSMFTQSMQNYLELEDPEEELMLSFTLITVDAKTYAELCRLAGVPLGSNILINYRRRHIDGRWTEFTPFAFNEQTITKVELEQETEIPLHGELRYGQIPLEVLHATRGWAFAIIVPEFYAATYYWFAQTANPRDFVMHMHDIFDEFICPDVDLVFTHVHNLAAAANQDRAIINLVMVFVYGFVGMLTLIGFTNVISTIYTNVRARAREFAVLQSVGMTRNGLSRMLNLESILCSFKSLVIGIPLGVAAAFMVYRSMLHSVEFRFEFPLFSILICILAVFIITWVTMRYAAARLRGKNIVETIRAE